MAAKPYNGFPSWNAWNVSLWINNDEGLYNMARETVKRYYRNGAVAMRKAESRAAAEIACDFASDKTPDGARYSETSLRHALRDICA